MRVSERQTGFLGLFVVLSILYCPLLGAAVIHVPGDQPTIQEGIDAAQNGDTVLVAAGTWVEDINFQGKSISVTSESGPAVTTIDSGPFKSVVTFAGGETLDALLEGFTITGGTGTEINGDGCGRRDMFLHTTDISSRPGPDDRRSHFHRCRAIDGC